jgi:hypothetical protein
MKNRKNSLILFFVWLVSVALTHDIVENPFYDFACYLHAAERFATGQVPYLDYQWIYPPLTVWTNGFIMRFSHCSYTAVNTLANLLALGLLLAEYRLARLILSRPQSLLCAVAAYGGMFATSSANGENFISSGSIYVGVTFFAWFVWCVAKGFILNRGIGYILAGGLCGGLSVLVKHEFMAGVAAVCLFLLFKTAVFQFKTSGNLLLFGMTLLGIAFAGFAEAARHCGWNNLLAGMTAYGTLKEHALRSWPSVVLVWQHLLLLVGYIALFLTLGLLKTNSSYSPFQERAQSLRKALMLWVMVFACAALEVVRVWFTIKYYGTAESTEIPQTVAWAGLYAKHVPDASSVVFYFGSIVCRNIIPVVMLLAIISILLLVGMFRHGLLRSLRSRRAILGLYCLAGLGLQARGQLSLSFPGVLDVALPLVIFFIPVFWMQFQTISLTSKGLRVLRQRCALTLLVICMTLSILLYAFEFRTARFSSLMLETDKGRIHLPITEENKAFKNMVDYVRNQKLKNIIAVPYCGIQYWTGHAAFPSWLGFIHPATYRPPWHTYLDRELAAQQVTFIVFDKLDINYLAFPTNHSVFWDGPWYKPYHWKMAFPEIWHEISTHSVLKASFGPENNAYFSIYTHDPSNACKSFINN